MTPSFFVMPEIQFRLNYPESSISHNNIGDAYLQKGLPNYALRHLKQAIEIDPEFAAAHDTHHLSLPSISLLLFLRCFRHEKCDLDSVSVRRMFQITLGDEHILRSIVGDDKALEYMEKVLSLKENDPYALNYIGYTWAEQGRNLNKSLDYLTRAAEQKPDDGFIKDKAQVVYFTGCTAAYFPVAQKIPVAFAQIMEFSQY